MNCVNSVDRIAAIAFIKLNLAARSIAFGQWTDRRGRRMATDPHQPNRAHAAQIARESFHSQIPNPRFQEVWITTGDGQCEQLFWQVRDRFIKPFLPPPTSASISRPGHISQTLHTSQSTPIRLVQTLTFNEPISPVMRQLFKGLRHRSSQSIIR
jgi:hypothetical protein